MSLNALQEYTRIAKYARYNKDLKRRESWTEQVDRIMSMHKQRYHKILPQLREDLDFVESFLKRKKVLGSQRSLQFGGKPILDKNERLYNCCASHCDRVRFFQETMFLLLCGCGVGFSVQKHHISKLPPIKVPSKIKKAFVIPDSIEGWADAVGVLMSCFFIAGQTFPDYANRTVEFDYSKIRPKGALLSHGAKAPGPEPLRRSLELIRSLLQEVCDSGPCLQPNAGDLELFYQLQPLQCHDIIMHLADSVISGGIRRAALISLFSPDDHDMATAKTGDWFTTNPQRGRCNNSAVLIRNKTTFEEFATLMQSVKDSGEPGFIWTDDTEAMFNPCSEINLYPIHDQTGETGFQFCNLCELNMKKCKDKQDFLDMCKAAAILGTLQAGYSRFPYLGETSEYITQREALLGVSMTGMMDNPEIAFNTEIQKEGAQVILKQNVETAKKIGINPAARSTCVKPAGSTSCILGTASGIHPHHAKRYFRRVQANELEAPLQHFLKYNPLAVETSVWDPNKVTKVITFVCEVPDGAKTKNQVDALTLLEYVKLTQQNWVEAGTRAKAMVKPFLRHNVSNTIHVKDNEWEIVTKFIFENKKFFAGISLLPAKGDKDYPQAPFCNILTDGEILTEYGNGSLLASGLIVDGLYAFDDNLWAACDCMLDIGEDLQKQERELLTTKYKDDLAEDLIMGFASLPLELIPEEFHDLIFLREKIDWVRRAKQFAVRYMNGDLKKTAYCLKDVHNYKLWLDLNREYLDVPWDVLQEQTDTTTLEETIACGGGQCDLF